MSRLTRQEQTVLCIVLGLLLTGWAVKAFRTAHPQTATKQSEGVSSAAKPGQGASAAMPPSRGVPAATEQAKN